MTTATITTKLIFLARTNNDTRDTASSIAEYHVTGGAKLSAEKMATEADTFGQSKIDEYVAAGYLVPAAHNRANQRVAAGHGATVVYASGTKKNVRGW